jgi:hypothetical protein
MMLSDSAPIITLILGVATFILIMFLPALLELKKPRDAGPRMIMNDVAARQLQQEMKPLPRIEDEISIDQVLVKKIADIIATLPNLEE